MQDEINEKTVTLCVNGGKMTSRILKNAMLRTLSQMDRERRQHHQDAKARRQEAKYCGKQSMKRLKAANVELSNIEITDGNIKSFEKYARKYDIDYCLKKDKAAEPPRYYVFFKAKDVDVITAAFKEYSGAQLNKPKKPSIRKRLEQAKERAAKHREREKTKQKDRGPVH